MRAPLRERLLSRLIIDHVTGCLLWTGTITPDGYGQIWINGRKELVHRAMWELCEGPIPRGLQLDHVKSRGCHNRHCASIAHLEPVPQRTNLLRGISPAAINSRKEACAAGHDYNQANTYLISTGGRHCRICSRLAARRYRARKATARRLSQATLTEATP